MNLLKRNPTRNPTRITRQSSKLLLTGALLLGASSVSGCNSAGEGMFSGAVLGTLTGLALGSLDGNAGEGALTGLIIGSAGGAILGDQNQRDRENSRYRGSDRRYNNYYDGHYGGRSGGHSGGHSGGYYSQSWWEEDWCD